jgi:hypothetical protein
MSASELVVSQPAQQVAQAPEGTAPDIASSDTQAADVLKPPVIEIIDPKDGSPADRTEMQLTYSAQTSPKSPITRIGATVDGLQVASEDTVITDGTREAARVGRIRLSILRRDAVISLIAYNKNGASSPALVHIIWQGADPSGNKPDLMSFRWGLAHIKTLA